LLFDSKLRLSAFSLRTLVTLILRTICSSRGF
jgi:hypothetical protein